MIYNELIKVLSSFLGKGRSGTFGDVRKQGTKRHYGYDLIANIGTPVFASYEGEVIKILDTVPEGREGNLGGGGYGNYIWIKSRVNGENYIFCYMHLRSQNQGGAIANGLQVGDHVLQGQVIGYSGNTGFAWNVQYSHLHFEVRSEPGTNKYSAINPEPFFNGTFTDGVCGISTTRCDNLGPDIDVW